MSPILRLRNGNSIYITVDMNNFRYLRTKYDYGRDTNYLVLAEDIEFSIDEESKDKVEKYLKEKYSE